MKQVKATVEYVIDNTGSCSHYQILESEEEARAWVQWITARILHKILSQGKEKEA